jgi:hypothetical protein
MDNTASLSYIPKITCPRHKDEYITNICLAAGCSDVLCCPDCILYQHSKLHKASLLTIQKFSQRVADHYDNIKLIKTAEQPLKEVQDLYSEKNNSINSFKQSVEDEKSRVNKMITDLQKSFTELCNFIRHEMFIEIDKPVEPLDSNFRIFQFQYESLYDNTASNFPSKKDVIQTINNVKDNNELDVYVKKMINDMYNAFNMPGDNMQEKVVRLKDQLLSRTKTLKNQLGYKSSVVSTMSQVQNSLDKMFFGFKNRIGSEFLNKTSTGNSTDDLGYAIDSKILTVPSDIDSLFNMFSPASVKFNLVYRGSRDGFYATSFHNKVDGKIPTVSIVETNRGRIFGGFTDQDFYSFHSKIKASANSFIFSISRREKYPIKPDCQDMALHTGDHWYIMSFGDNDFYLENYCNTNENSYCNFGTSYEAKGLPRESLAGAYKFTVKEVETYTVEFEGQYP